MSTIAMAKPLSNAEITNAMKAAVKTGANSAEPLMA
jgi:hypothetical protein